jgi:hypothetical protein
MLALIQIVEGLFAAHLFLTLSFLVGSVLLPWCYEDLSARRPARVMLMVACTCALGIAIVGFVDFIVAVVHGFNALGLAVAYFAVFAIACAVRRDSPLRVNFWRCRLQALGAAWDIPLLCVYYILLLLCAPAILPNLGGSDPIAFHLANAADLVRHVGFAVDPFRRSPLYVGNFVLIFGEFLTFGGGQLLNFLTWATGLLTGLAVCAGAGNALSNVREPWRSIVATALTLAVFVNPVYLRWGASAYMDVQIGCFALVSVLSLILAVEERRVEWFAAAAAIAGFLVGLKPSFPVLVPIYMLGMVGAALAMRIRMRQAAALIAIFIALASPWYLRNLVLAGDPVPPVFNLAIYGHDGFVTKAEWHTLMQDLHTTRDASALANLPFRAFFDPKNRDFRENGEMALFLALYLPVISVLVVFGFGRRLNSSHVLAAYFLMLFVVYWFVTATLLRYAMLFVPLLSVAFAYTAASVSSFDECLLTRRWFGPILAALSIVALVPSPGSSAYYRHWHADYASLMSYPGFERYIAVFGNGDAEAMFTVNMIERAKIDTSVYVIGPGVAYYFLRANITTMGDWIGPAGWFRLYSALDAGQIDQYMRALHARVVLVDPSRVIGGLDVPLGRALESAHFCSVKIPNSAWQLYVDSESICRNKRVPEQPVALR